MNEIERLFLKDYQKHSADLSKPYPGVLETLTKLKKAGFQMLPVIEKESNRTNRQILWHAFLLIPVSLFFVVTGVLGEIYFWGASALGFGYLISGIPLLKDTTFDNAKLLLKTSIIYLPALLIVIFIDLNS